MYKQQGSVMSSFVRASPDKVFRTAWEVYGSRQIDGDSDHIVAEYESETDNADPGSAGGRRRGAAAGDRGPEDDRQVVEDDGQSVEAVPAPAHEHQELAAVHTGHSAGHFPAAETRRDQLRGPLAAAVI